ncbi:MAG TPA: elongation factor P [Phycisphaerae bacterium]|nr:elongation factor P [Phycisphaerae bacterium]
MAVKASELKKGQVVLLDGVRYTIKDMQHVAKGNWRSYYQVKLKDFKTGRVLDQRMAVDDRVEMVYVETKPMEYIYKDGDSYVLADPITYDQVSIEADVIGDGIQFLKENIVLTCTIIEGLIVNVELPFTVELAVKNTVPAIKGATATNQSKEATLETGARVRVPPFIEVGEVVRIDTRTGEYLERAK